MRLFAVIFNHCDLTSYHDFVLRFVMFFSATLMQPECGPQSTDWVAWWSTKQRSPEQIPMKKAVIKTSILMARTLKTEIEGKLCLHARVAHLKISAETHCVKSHTFCPKIEFWRSLVNHLIWIFAPKFNNFLEYSKIAQIKSRNDNFWPI